MKSRSYLNKLRESETDDTKLCTACEHILPLNKFANHRNTRKGKASKCKKCIQQDRINKGINSKKNIEKINRVKQKKEQEDTFTKWCLKCNRYLTLDKYYKAKGRRKAVSDYCIDCLIKQYDEKQKNIQKNLEIN